MTVRFVLLVNKQGQTRLAHYNEIVPKAERRQIEGEIVQALTAAVPGAGAVEVLSPAESPPLVSFEPMGEGGVSVSSPGKKRRDEHFFDFEAMEREAHQWEKEEGEKEKNEGKPEDNDDGVGSGVTRNEGEGEGEGGEGSTFARESSYEDAPKAQVLVQDPEPGSAMTSSSVSISSAAATATWQRGRQRQIGRRLSAL